MWIMKKKPDPGQTSSDTEGAPDIPRRLLPPLLKLCIALLLLLLVLAWASIPALRALNMIANNANRSAPSVPGDLVVQEIHFLATDGVHLAGWLVLVAPDAP